MLKWFTVSQLLAKYMWYSSASILHRCYYDDVNDGDSDDDDDEQHAATSDKARHI